jgi:bifunctional DNase/RNase
MRTRYILADQRPYFVFATEIPNHAVTLAMNLQTPIACAQRTLRELLLDAVQDLTNRAGSPPSRG